jgi:CBS domain-containing protein
MAHDNLKLGVRTRRTLRPDWSEEEVEMVPCPTTGASRSLDECRACAQAAGVLKDCTGHSFVTCRSEPSPPRLPSQWSVDAAWERMSVAEIMTEDPLCIHRDVQVAQVVTLLVEHSISGTPVVDDLGRPVGVVSRADVLMNDYEQAEEEERALGEHTRYGVRTAADIMTHGGICVSERATVLDAIRLLAQHGIHRLPVVDDAGCVVGVLSTLDIVRALSTRTQRR